MIILILITLLAFNQIDKKFLNSQYGNLVTIAFGFLAIGVPFLPENLIDKTLPVVPTDLYIVLGYIFLRSFANLYFLVNQKEAIEIDFKELVAMIALLVPSTLIKSLFVVLIFLPELFGKNKDVSIRADIIFIAALLFIINGGDTHLISVFGIFVSLLGLIILFLSAEKLEYFGYITLLSIAHSASYLSKNLTLVLSGIYALLIMDQYLKTMISKRLVSHALKLGVVSRVFTTLKVKKFGMFYIEIDSILNESRFESSQIKPRTTQDIQFNDFILLCGFLLSVVLILVTLEISGAV